MRTPHKHAALIKAWADGAAIQTYSYGQEAWIDCPDPFWLNGEAYRVAPEPKRYRVAECKDINACLYLYVVSQCYGKKLPLEPHGFVRWVGDWIEYE